MKYCYACGHRTGGEPLFCNSCGRSYDVKLCPKLHVNPRIAEACSQCGSRDLSVPQPRVPVLWQFLAILGQTVSGLLLLCVSVPVLGVFFTDLSVHTVISDWLFVGIFLLVVLWSFWIMLPDASRWIIHRSLIQKSGLFNGRNSQ